MKSNAGSSRILATGHWPLVATCVVVPFGEAAVPFALSWCLGVAEFLRELTKQSHGERE